MPPSRIVWSQRFSRLPAASLLLAKRMLESGDYPRAMREVDAALAENPELADAHFIRGLVLVLRGDAEAGQEALEACVQHDPRHETAWYALAHLRRQAKALGEALAAVDRAVEINDSHADSHLLRGSILTALQREDEAIQEFRLALQRDPLLTMARHKLGNLLARRGDKEAAIEQIAVIYRLSPLDADCRILLGDLFRELGQAEAAIEQYRRASELVPKNRVCWARLGDVCLQQQQYAEAASALQTAVQLNPKDVDSFLNLGRLQLQQGQRTEALQSFRTAVEIDPRYPLAAELLAGAEKTRDER